MALECSQYAGKARHTVRTVLPERIGLDWMHCQRCRGEEAERGDESAVIREALGTSLIPRARSLQRQGEIIERI